MNSDEYLEYLTNVELYGHPCELDALLEDDGLWEEIIETALGFFGL